jgi:hypothetical protein
MSFLSVPSSPKLPVPTLVPVGHDVPKLISVDHATSFADGSESKPPAVQLPPPTPTILSDAVLEEWGVWSATSRIAALRRWMLNMEWNWGSIGSWSSKCAEKWATIKENNIDYALQWLEEEARKVAAGHQMMGYLGRIMEGQLPTDVETACDLYVQGHKMTLLFDGVVIGLDSTLAILKSEVQQHSGQKCGCGKATCMV